ncbi:hypothetical protein QAD02_007377 [Eretmocerus hayati]|uniref:Uncharacterized protein n=1 Tax=Eretmocerus hayati TaxID=131215 RepID=A0ACC2N7T3_9HYME|nr:hypothetical protein QAD02_007377 [Eretmocerus hayati]
MGSSWYSTILARHPFIIVLCFLILSLAFLIIPTVFIRKLPDFSDPQLGFEARGTSLSQRLITWKNLVESSRPRGILIDNPLEYYHYLREISERSRIISEIEDGYPPSRTRRPKKNRKKKKFNTRTDDDNEKTNRNNRTRELSSSFSRPRRDISYLQKNQHDYESNPLDQEYLSRSEFFCNNPTSQYARVVVSSETIGKKLWSIEGVAALCNLDSLLRSGSRFTGLCQRQLTHGNRCCRTWSLANYIVFLANRTSCLDITESDIFKVKETLLRCSYYYQSRDLTPDCSEDPKCQRKVPVPCYLSDAAYHILHYLLDTSSPKESSEYRSQLRDSPKLEMSLMILPIAASSASLKYYNEIIVANLSHSGFHVSAMELGLKYILFDRSLISDSVLLLLGSGFVSICILLYTGSILIMLSTILAIILSLGISYVVYTHVLQISHFPFMNLLTIVVAVGIGSDDAFIFCKIWEDNKRFKSLNARSDLVRLVHETLRHAVPAIFVTTLTTSVAFFASIVSHVTAINCFSLFSGMTVIANFFLMITWFPACVVAAEKFGRSEVCSRAFILQRISVFLRRQVDKTIQWFTKALIKTAVSMSWMWSSLLLAIGIGSCLVVFYYPGIQLPDSPNFQLFDISHPFEQYDMVYKIRFGFERQEMNMTYNALPLRFVWGIMPTDNGNHLDPESLGSLDFDPTFNATTRSSQIWLQDFCRNLTMQPFYRKISGLITPNCFVESLQQWMNRPCKDRNSPIIDYTPCCNSSIFPYEPSVLKQCSAEAIAELHRLPTDLWDSKSAAGLKFRQNNHGYSKEKYNVSDSRKFIPEIQVVIVEYYSVYNFSLAYTHMDKFYTEVESWMQNQLLNAPPGMKNGWFVSQLEFYELQRTLHDGTLWGIVLSMSLAFFVLILITCNLFVSFFAILSIAFAITATVAILVLMGWKLNVLESVVVSTAIGLATDFSLHYSASYRASIAEYRIDRTMTTLKQMGGPTLMAGLTTGAAGALMFPSQVLAYIQIGTFLVIIMTVSWFYATFFLCPLLAIAGPSARPVQKQFSKDWKSSPRFRKRVLKSERNSRTITHTSEEPIFRLTSLLQSLDYGENPEAQGKSFNFLDTQDNRTKSTDSLEINDIGARTVGSAEILSNDRQSLEKRLDLWRREMME